MYRFETWAVGGLLIGLLAFSIYKGKKFKHPLARASLGLPLLTLSMTALIVAGYLASWYRGRSEVVDHELTPGLRHVRLSITAPRHAVANLVFVDLSKDTLLLTITPPDSDFRPKIKASTVGQFAESSRSIVAMNANFFHPFYSNSPWDYYPRVGDPIEVLGIAASEGDVYSTQSWRSVTFNFSRSNTVEVVFSGSTIWNAISGDQWLIRDGTVTAHEDAFGPYPRAAAAVSQEGTTLILACVDGKQTRIQRRNDSA